MLDRMDCERFRQFMQVFRQVFLELKQERMKDGDH
jgi:hypothetical protein